MALASSLVISAQASIFSRFAETAVDFWQLAKLVTRPIEQTSAIWRIFDETNALIIEISSFVFQRPAARQPNRSVRKPAPRKINNTGRKRGDGKPGRKAARASCKTWRP